ncbi:MAG: sulfatase-like hydrolase/transferase, partial [Planctomycetota bacterium]
MDKPRIGILGLMQELYDAFIPGITARQEDYARAVAAHLRDCGYATMAAGKWHVGCREEHLPTRHGFDRYFGLLYSNDMAPLALYRDEVATDEPVDQAALTRRYTEEALAFIDEKRDQPFFLYLAHTMPHVPLAAEPEFLGKSACGLYGDTIECIDHNIGVLLQRLEEHGIA